MNAADYTEILNLEALYARCWDRNDAEGWAGVFAEDGIFEIAPAGDRAPLRVQGRPALARFCADFNAVHQGVHLPSIPWLRFEDDRAFGHLNFHFTAVARHSPTHTVNRVATGHYEVTYHRMDGRWLMAHRIENPFQSARSESFDY